MPDITDKLTDNPLVDAAQTKIGPLPAWQWGAVIGVGVIALRLVLPPSGSGSFFRRADKNATSDTATIGTGLGGIDRRPVAPSAGLPPGPPLSPGFTTGDQIMPGATTPNPFLSVTTPGGINIAGDGLTPGDVVDIIGALLPPRSATTRVPVPRPSPPTLITPPNPRGRTPNPAPRAPVAPRNPQVVVDRKPVFRSTPPPAPRTAPRPAPPRAPAPKRTTNAPVAPRKIKPQYGRTRPKKRTPKRSGSGGSRNKMF